MTTATKTRTFAIAVLVIAAAYLLPFGASVLLSGDSGRAVARTESGPPTAGYVPERSGKPRPPENARVEEGADRADDGFADGEPHTAGDAAASALFGLLRTPRALQASLYSRGDPTRVSAAILRARRERRPLRVAVVGSSYSAGAYLKDPVRDAFPEVLRRLLSRRKGAGLTREEGGFGVELVNGAQGAAGFSLFIFCLEKMIARRGSFTGPADVYIADFEASLDGPAEMLSAFLASLLSGTRSHPDGSAAIVASVTKAECLGGGKTPWQCPHMGKFNSITVPAAQPLGVPVISWIHGVLAARDISPTDGFPGDLSKGAQAALQSDAKLLFARNGADMHFGELGHRVMAEQIWNYFRDAWTAVSSLPASQHPTPPFPLPHVEWPASTLSLLSRFSDLNRYTIQCNTTLSHLDSDLAASTNESFHLQTYETGDRIDIKRTWTPTRENATVTFLIPIRNGTTTLCATTMGRAIPVAKLRVTFPDDPGSGSGDRIFECGFVTGYPPYPHVSFYRTNCCPSEIPKGVADGETHVVKVEAAVGLPQLASLIFY
ncbi:hypothetical protein DFJ74DRAFT_700866 [Hyaloraphidium curvatum]|nr:hypothetical protein DFJ74DRAFT_700866 [Hyaloraphidium curvatum]